MQLGTTMLNPIKSEFYVQSFISCILMQVEAGERKTWEDVAGFICEEGIEELQLMVI
jgi:hypothetical protein